MTGCLEISASPATRSRRSWRACSHRGASSMARAVRSLVPGQPQWKRRGHGPTRQTTTGCSRHPDLVPEARALGKAPGPRSAVSRLRPAAADEDVAGPPHGLEHLGLLWMSLDLAPYAGDADIDAAVEHVGVAVMRQLE